MLTPFEFELDAASDAKWSRAKDVGSAGTTLLKDAETGPGDGAGVGGEAMGTNMVDDEEEP